MLIKYITKKLILIFNTNLQSLHVQPERPRVDFFSSFFKQQVKSKIQAPVIDAQVAAIHSILLLSSFSLLELLL